MTCVDSERVLAKTMRLSSFVMPVVVDRTRCVDWVVSWMQKVVVGSAPCLHPGISDVAPGGVWVGAYWGDFALALVLASVYVVLMYEECQEAGQV